MSAKTRSLFTLVVGAFSIYQVYTGNTVLGVVGIVLALLLLKLPVRQ
jgi:uncharacterized membrane protein